MSSQISYMSSMKMAKGKNFSYIKSLYTVFGGVDTLQKDGILYSYNQDKPNVLNYYISTVFAKSDNSVLPNMGLSHCPDINGIEITIAGVKKFLLGLA